MVELWGRSKAVNWVSSSGRHSAEQLALLWVVLRADRKAKWKVKKKGFQLVAKLVDWRACQRVSHWDDRMVDLWDCRMAVMMDVQSVDYSDIERVC